MSAGDIDDTLGPKGRLEELCSANLPFAEYYSSIDQLPIALGTIPFGAGISSAGSPRYIDERLNTMLLGIDIGPVIARHESVEWALRRLCGIGDDYQSDPTGHRLANRAEYEALAKLFPNHDPGTIWERYDEFLDPQLTAIEKSPLYAVPEDLALYPYVDTPWYYRLRAAMATPEPKPRLTHDDGDDGSYIRGQASHRK